MNQVISNPVQNSLIAPSAKLGPVRVARVAVPKPLFSLFDYQIPLDSPVPCVGARVQVPFGRSQIIGICMAIDPPDAHTKLKPLSQVLDQDNLLGDELMQLANWLSDYYQFPLGEVFATILPTLARRGESTEPPAPEMGWGLTNHDHEPPNQISRAPKQANLWHLLAELKRPVSKAEIFDAGFTAAVLNGLASKGLIVRQPLDVLAIQPTPPANLEAPLTLNDEQQIAVNGILSEPNQFRPFLLQGITGSGKTEVYLQAIEQVLNDQRQVLVLVPEIALTPQTVSRFERRFGTTDILHSNLSDKVRFQTWLRCRNGQSRIVIGTRSAALAPFQNLGLIVVDEEHDGSFKQTDGLRYSARDVAVKRAHKLQIPLVLGTATPSLESLANAQTERYQTLRLNKRAGGANSPTMQLLDIRGHQLSDGISQPLRRLIGEHLAARNQVLIFLNRRGFSPSYLCPRCGWQAQCNQCEARMTYHRSTQRLICHHCGTKTPVPQLCGGCELAAPIPIGVGTQRTEEGLANLFPDVRILRIDRDATRTQTQLENQLAAINTGEPAILVGTQMLAKGHHFADVTLVAVLDADAGFASADYRAPERTAALIVQVAGRAGRAQKPGEVWIQTYQPDNPALIALIEQGYEGFAERELETRARSQMPPFRHMALIRSESTDASAAIGYIGKLTDAIAADIEVMGPIAAPIARINNRYRYQSLLLAMSRSKLNQALAALRTEPVAQKTPSKVRWSIDVDPYDTY